jgi:tetratricopeptide (TPR) repeat protein
VPRAGEIVAITETDLPLDMTFPITWATVRFADDPEATPRVLLGRRETSYVWVGQSVVVHVRSGALGVPWVRRVERDEEQYYRKVLATFSDAAEAWKGLVRTYFDQRRWQDAERAALDYLARYPNDYEFAYSTASEFAVSRHYGPTVAMLEPFLGRRQDYVFYNSLGWSLAHVGQVNRGIELLKSSIPLDPNNFWAYYHLGYLYVRTRQTADAIEMFRNVLERRPNFPEVEAQLRALENGTRAKPPGAEG